MIKVLSKFTVLSFLLFTAELSSIGFEEALAQTFNVTTSGELKIIQGRPEGISTSFRVRGRGEIMPGRTIISTTIAGVVPIVPVVVSTIGGAPTSDNSIDRSGSGGRGKYDASKWILDKKYDELVLEGKNKPHLASAPKNNSVIFDKHGQPVIQESELIVKDNLEQNKQEIDLLEDKNNKISENNINNFISQEVKNIKKLELADNNNNNNNNNNLEKFSKELLASIIFDLDQIEENSFGFKTSAEKIKTEIEINPREDKLMQNKETYKILSFPEIFRPLIKEPNYWEILAIALLQILLLFLILFIALAILVFIMHCEEKREGGNRKSFIKNISKWFGVLALILIFSPEIYAQNLEGNKTEAAEYKVEISENIDENLNLEENKKEEKRKVININDVYLWILNKEKVKNKKIDSKNIRLLEPENDWRNLAYFFKDIALMLVLIIFIIALMLFKKCVDRCFLKKNKLKEIKKSKIKSKKKKSKKILSILFLIFISSLNFLNVQAVETTPQIMIYEGNLLDTSGNPIVGSHDFRFSLWTNADFEPTDVAGGIINFAAPDYLGWTETQTQTVGSAGGFSFQVGAITAFAPTLFNQDDTYFQVEIKKSADPDTSFEVIDINASDPLEDRKVIASVPYAFNANRLDYRELGFGAGEIPYLNTNGKIDTANLETAPDALLLGGKSIGYLGNEIPYVDNITGKLPTSIIPASASALVGGVNGNMFTIDLDGDALPTDTLMLDFGSALGKFLSWNGVNDRFEFNDDLQVGGNLTVSGTINGVTIGPKDQNIILSPRYPNSIFEGLGDNGYMYEETETITGNEKNIIRWRTNDTLTQQNYSNIIRYKLPSNFKSFKPAAFSLLYKTMGGLIDSKIDLIVQKEGTLTDEISGSGLNLNSGSWTDTGFALLGTTTWNPDDVMIIKIKMYAKGAAETKISDITLNYITE